MSAIGGNLALSVAGLQLQLVQDLVGAIRAADAGAAAAATSAPVASAPVAAAAAVDCGSNLRLSQVSAVDQPLTYRAVDSQLNHAAVTYDRHRPDDAKSSRAAEPTPEKTVTEPAVPPLIQPPWRTLPWPAVSGAAKVVHRIVKIAPGRADVRDVGQMLDVFV